MRIARTVAPPTSALVSTGVTSSARGCHHVRKSLSTARRLERLPAADVALVQRFALSGAHPAETAPWLVPVKRCGTDEGGFTCSSPSSPMYAGSMPRSEEHTSEL